MSLIFNYVDTPNSNLICCICRAPFVRPVTTQTCAHTFCHECIIRALEHSPHCPVDRRSVTVQELADAGGIVRALVDELMVECPHRTEGCDTTCQRQMMPVHLKEECLFREGRESDDLSEVGTKKDRDKAEEEEQIKCPHAAHGCTFSCDLDTSLSEHLFVCPYESLKGYISHNNAKVALLTEQNIVLRHRLGTTDNTLQILKKEMGMIKGILGPWYHGSSRDANPGSGSMDDPASRRRSVDDSSSSVERDRADVSFYFGGHHHQGGGGLFKVPPLDIENTVEGSLAGLRESVVDLAGAVDAVGRRGEMALANETLRLGEEIMSIRAQIHGLRMQVHGILLERNAMAEGLRFQVGPSNITKL